MEILCAPLGEHFQDQGLDGARALAAAAIADACGHLTIWCNRHQVLAETAPKQRTVKERAIVARAVVAYLFITERSQSRLSFSELCDNLDCSAERIRGLLFRSLNRLHPGSLMALDSICVRYLNSLKARQ